MPFPHKRLCCKNTPATAALRTLPTITVTSGLVLLSLLLLLSLLSLSPLLRSAPRLPPSTPHGAAAAKPAERARCRHSTANSSATEHTGAGRKEPTQTEQSEQATSQSPASRGPRAARPAPHPGGCRTPGARGAGAPCPPGTPQHSPRAGEGTRPSFPFPSLPSPQAHQHRHPEWIHCWKR